VIATKSYDQFVDAASYELRAEGSRVLFDRNAGGIRSDWLTSWDQILVNETPGAAALSAFTSGDGADIRVLQGRVDSLAAGLADLGLFRGAPLALNVVVAFEYTPEPHLRKSAAHLVPRAFFPGLRPRSFAVDLAATVVAGGRGTALRGVLEGAIQATAHTATDAVDMELRHQVHRARTSQFYELMQGRQPVVTYGLVLINVIVFVLMLLSSGNAASAVLRGGPFPDGSVRDWGAQSPSLIQHGQWWRLFTEMFLHASLTHIVFNMASLLAVGTLAERLYGSVKFLAIYLGAGLIGSIVSFSFAVMQGNLDVLGVGASGAIFGVAGALLTVRFQHSDLIPAALRRRVSSSMAPLVLISLLFAALTPYVDNSAHVGGLIGGMALSFAFPLTTERKPSRE
jgi:membrane associated rhomboid family serine protease